MLLSTKKYFPTSISVNAIIESISHPKISSPLFGISVELENNNWGKNYLMVFDNWKNLYSWFHYNIYWIYWGNVMWWNRFFEGRFFGTCSTACVTKGESVEPCKAEIFIQNYSKKLWNDKKNPFIEIFSLSIKLPQHKKHSLQNFSCFWFKFCTIMFFLHTFCIFNRWN